MRSYRPVRSSAAIGDNTVTTYFLTGGTGFIGRRVIRRLLENRPDATVYALVRAGSLTRFSEMFADVSADRLHPVVGDLTAPGLGMDPADTPTTIDHVIHLGAIYDMTADAQTQQRANVDGTAHVADLAADRDAMLHHVSSIAVAGDHSGAFTEADFDLGQGFPTPYHRTKFEAEKLVRERDGLRWRVYRPSVVVGDSRTGEMDKVDGPYYFFPRLRLLGMLPSALIVPMPDLGRLNLVPVDFVVDAIVALADTDPDRIGLVFHLADPKDRGVVGMYNALAPGFGGPRGIAALDRRLVAPMITLSGAGPVKPIRDLIAIGEGIPPAVLDATRMSADFRADETITRLGGLGVTLPDLDDYGPRLWRYWAEHLDPARHRRSDPRGPLVGKHILITGGSSGIGKATARMCVARGADVYVVARNADDLAVAVAELNASQSKPGVPPGRAFGYPCDVTDEESVRTLVKNILGEHGHVDILVNNAGRSIRRATRNATDRSHDYQRVMAVNYFAAVNLVLALLPHMVERQSGHVVNVSSIAVQTHGARFGAYAASKAALEAFSESTGAETLSDHVTFTNVRLPLVRTRMIAPTEAYRDSLGVWNVDKAAATVLRAIVAHPARISPPIGHLAEFGRRVAPRLTAWILHQEYLLMRESAAALGTVADPSDTLS